MADTDTGQEIERKRSRLEDISAGPRGIELRTAADFWSVAQYVHASGLAPKDLDTPQKVFVAMQMGAEVGTLPMTSLRNIAVINGRPSIWGDLMLGLIVRSGQLEDIEETFDEERMVAACRVVRKGRPTPIVRTFSKNDAVTAGLWGKTGYNGKPTPWVTNPKRMLQLRARGFCIRDGFPDFLGGYALAEEAQDMPPVDVEASEHERRSDELEARLRAQRQAGAAEPGDEPVDVPSREVGEDPAA